MKKIILCRGIQGSGKTTWAKQWVLEKPTERVRINNDDIRNMLGKYLAPEREKLVNQIRYDILFAALYNGYDIVIDNMNLNKTEVSDIEITIKTFNDGIPDKFQYEIEFKDFITSLDVCIERDSKRENPVGENVIRGTYKKYNDFYTDSNEQK